MRRTSGSASGGTSEEAAQGGRSARKRRAIIDAATALFLRNGYQGTSMDDIAARAAVSKQTVYKNFADKEQLFTEIVHGVTGASDQIVARMGGALENVDIDNLDDLRQALAELARRYLDAVLQPHVLALRRLVIAEADRFPDLARSYYERGPARGVDVIASALRTYSERGLLRMDDAQLAENHLAYLILGIPQDRALFLGERLGTRRRNRIADEAVRVFLAAYGARSGAT